MPSTFTSSLRQEIQATGENETTWGDKANANFAIAIEDAIAGVSTLQMSNADYQLSVAFGAADEARKAILIATGNVPQPRNIIVPNATKSYIVRNITSGGQPITIKTASGSGVAIVNGEVGIVFCDGANVISAAAVTADGSLIPSKVNAGSGAWRFNGSVGVNRSITLDANIGAMGLDGAAGSIFLMYYNGTLIGSMSGYTDKFDFSTSNKPITFTTNGVTRVTIDTAGNVSSSGPFSASSLTSTGSLTVQTTMSVSGHSTVTTLNGTTLSASTNFILLSDERKKHKWLDIPKDFIARLAQVKAGSFVFKATGARGTRHVGISAQSMQTAWAEAVDASDPTELKIKMGFVSAAVVGLARKCMELEARLKEMEDAE